MEPVARRVLDEATQSDAYWNLSAGEKLVWMIERAFQIGKERQNTKGRRRRPRYSKTRKAR